jgi:hypothetical protein
MKKLKLTLLALMISVCTINAQNGSVNNVLKLRSIKDSGQIIENKKIVGYYIFYMKEKVDKNNSSYEIEIFDDNYNSQKTLKLQDPKTQC